MTDFSDISYLIQPQALAMLMARAGAVNPPALIDISGKVPVINHSLGPAVIPDLQYWNESNGDADTDTVNNITSTAQVATAFAKDQAYLFSDQLTLYAVQTSSSASATSLAIATASVAKDNGLVAADAVALGANANSAVSNHTDAAQENGRTYPNYATTVLSVLQAAYAASGTVDKNHQLGNIHISGFV